MTPTDPDGSWADVAGPIELSTTTDIPHGSVTVRATQRLGSRQVAGYIRVPNELIADGAASIDRILEAALDRRFRPWRYPDRNPFPVIDLFPRWTRFVRRLRMMFPTESERITP